MPYCRECGAAVGQSDRYCEECGAAQGVVFNGSNNQLLTPPRDEHVAPPQATGAGAPASPVVGSVLPPVATPVRSGGPEVYAPAAQVGDGVTVKPKRDRNAVRYAVVFGLGWLFTVNLALGGMYQFARNFLPYAGRVLVGVPMLIAIPLAGVFGARRGLRVAAQENVGGLWKISLAAIGGLVGGFVAGNTVGQVLEAFVAIPDLSLLFGAAASGAGAFVAAEAALKPRPT